MDSVLPHLKKLIEKSPEELVPVNLERTILRAN
jgi:hypothetical protein